MSLERNNHFFSRYTFPLSIHPGLNVFETVADDVWFWGRYVAVFCKRAREKIFVDNFTHLIVHKSVTENVFGTYAPDP
ncbi:MAG: hypothetical protein NVS2B12_35970 [Ktedonobacteraceae bacterium]